MIILLLISKYMIIWYMWIWICIKRKVRIIDGFVFFFLFFFNVTLISYFRPECLQYIQCVFAEIAEGDDFGAGHGERHIPLVHEYVLNAHSVRWPFVWFCLNEALESDRIKMK